MKETLLSAGIDIGTSTTQIVLSRLTLVNEANPFSVPRIRIAQREIVYRSGIHFTPLLNATTIDGEGVRAIVALEYEKAGVRREDIQTGAVIITGETARKENAREVLSSLSGFAGDFVVATAGPDLESILAARGAGVDQLSKEKRAAVLHYDIGGGTSNLALYENGTLRSTGCLDVGGRLIQVDSSTRAVTYVAEKLKPFFSPEGGVDPALDAMVEALLEAAKLKPETSKLRHFITHQTVSLDAPPQYVSFSGGVADCMWDPPADPYAYGDVGVLLGGKIRRAFEAAGVPILRGAETIRATVVGAGAYSTDVSGSTIFYRGVDFPLKNIPVLKLTPEEEHGAREAFVQAVRDKLGWYADESGVSQVAVALEGEQAPSYARIQALAENLVEGLKPMVENGHIPFVILQRDMAKVIGQAMAPLCPGALLAIDSVAVEQGDYVDIGAPVAGGAVLPIVVKTIAFEEKGTG